MSEAIDHIFDISLPAIAPGLQICSRCIMDSTDPNINFDLNGVCNHCRYYEEIIEPSLPRTNDAKKRGLEKLLIRIRKEGEGKDYDCIIGLSGGVDSSYVAYLAKIKWGLRALVVHFDGGWNSELAVKNIENIVRKLEIDLYTFVCDWKEMRDLQLSFFRAGVANADTPQDHAIQSVLKRVAHEKRIKFILSGKNKATESILPTAWGHDSNDARHIEGIQKHFGSLVLKKYPLRGFLKTYLYDAYFSKMEMVGILDYTNYVKADAIKVLQDELDWKYYGGKHYESVFTRFFQGHYLPGRFGFDKRKAHLSSLIMSGQMTRTEALDEISVDSYSAEMRSADMAFVAKKLAISEEEMNQLIESEPRSFSEFPSSFKVLRLLRKIKGIFS